MKKILLSLTFTILFAVNVFSNTGNTYIGATVGGSTSTMLGYETETYDSFISYQTSSNQVNQSKSNLSIIQFGILLKNKVTENIDAIFGGSYGILSQEVNNISYSGGGFSLLVGVKHKLADKLSLKVLISPISTAEAESTEVDDKIKGSSSFSSLIGLSYYL